MFLPLQHSPSIHCAPFFNLSIRSNLESSKNSSKHRSKFLLFALLSYYAEFQQFKTMAEGWLWLLFFLILICLVVTVIYQLMCLSDLELDYINPYDSAKRINMVILPEFFTQGILGILFLLTGHWVMALFSIPYAYYNFRLYSRQEHLIDVTEIFNLLNREKHRRILKLGYIALLIVITLFWLIYSALEDDESFE